MRTQTQPPEDADLAAVAVRELTVGEIRAWLKEPFAGAEPDVVGALLLADTGMTLADLQRFTTLDAATLEAATPSALRALALRVKEVNADFFALLAAAAGFARAPNPSPEPSAG